MVIVETPIFTRRMQAILADDEYRLLQAQLVQKPDAGKSFPAAEVCASFAGQRVAMENEAASGLSIIGLYRQRSF